MMNGDIMDDVFKKLEEVDAMLETVKYNLFIVVGIIHKEL